LACRKRLIRLHSGHIRCQLFAGQGKYVAMKHSKTPFRELSDPQVSRNMVFILLCVVDTRKAPDMQAPSSDLATFLRQVRMLNL